MSFDPNEPRDSGGRWTDGNGVEWATTGDHRFTAPGHPKIDLANQTTHLSETTALRIMPIVRDAAKALDFDPEKVTITDRSYDFQVNGQAMTAAGTAHRDDGRITIYADKVVHTPDYIPQLMAHEVMHQKFNKYMADVQADNAAMQKDPQYVLSADRGHDGKDSFMNPNGTLNEPYASRYPLYQAHTKLSNEYPTEEFARTDGVSPYSKDYWTDWLNGKTATDVAYHETLAEIARVKNKDAEIERDHRQNVRHIIKGGGSWTKDDEAEWRKNRSGGYMRFKQGKEPVDGKKVYFATSDGSPRHLSRAWSALYKAVEDNWKRK